LQWAKKLGWLFLAVGGRSSMENDCWLQCWVALTLGISYGSHPLTSYIFLYLPTCFFVSTGAMLNVLWLVSLSGSLVHPRSGEPRLIGTGDSGRCTEIGKKGRIAKIASDIGNEHWRYMNIHEYTYILRTWIMNLKWLEESWRYLRSLCLMLFACVYLLYNLARRLIAGLASDVRHGAHGQSLGRAESCWVLQAVGSG